MPLEFEAHDEIPEPLRDEFVQLDGKGNWVPKDYVPKTTHEEMKGRLEAQSSDLGELRKRAEAWGEDDPAELRKQAAEAAKASEKLTKLKDDLKAAQAAKAELEAKATGKDPKEVDQLVKEAKEALAAEMAEQHRVELEAKDEKVKSMAEQNQAVTSRLDVLEVDTAIAMEAASIDDFVGENLPDAQRWGREVFKRDDKGNLVPYLTPELANGSDPDKVGKPWYVGDRLATPKDLMAALRERRKSWFKAPASGGGTGGDNGKPTTGAKTRPAEDRNQMTPAEQLKFAKEGGEFV